MADKLGLNSEVRELKIGASFLNSKTAFHTLRYDFKPASVVTASKSATVEIGPNQEVTVTHLDTSGTPQTVFKGSQRPYQKRMCAHNRQNYWRNYSRKADHQCPVEKTRQELPKMPSLNCSSGRPTTPVEKKPSPPQSNKHNKSSKGTVKQSPLHVSPYRSPTPASHTIHKSPPPITSVSLSPSPSAGSLPLIGLDDANDNSTNSFDINNALPELKSSPDFSGINFNEEESSLPEVGILSDSSSDSSSDSNSSDSDSDSGKPPPPPPKPMNGHMNGTSSPSLPSMQEDLLNADLQLSESGSDTD